MSEIKALERLHKDADHITDQAQGYDYSRVRNLVRHYADAIQAEVDERFMELPVDADGVPIRVGDTVEWLVKNGDYEVVAVGELVALKLGEDGSFTIAADALRHVKPRTLEDALADMANNIAMQVDGKIHYWKASDFGDEAAEIRELLGVDA